MALARQYPGRNFIGVDLKGNRIWSGAKKALDEGLKNVAFLRTQIESITDYFAEGEVSEIWITFPDPQLRMSKAKKRLTHPRFLRLYKKIMKEGGFIHLKTDSPDLYNFTSLVAELYELNIAESYSDVYAEPDIHEDLKIKTYYESLDIAGSNKVHYLKFSIPKALPPEKDNQLKLMLNEITA